MGQFYIFSLSDITDGENMHLTVMKKRFNKEVQMVHIIHIKDLIFNIFELYNIFLQFGDAVKFYVNEYFIFIICCIAELQENLRQD